MKLRRLDLNLLHAFATVHAERSVSRAGEAPGLSQPAVQQRRALGADQRRQVTEGEIEPAFFARRADRLGYQLAVPARAGDALQRDAS